MRFQYLVLFMASLSLWTGGAAAQNRSQQPTATGLWQQLDSQGKSDGWFLIYENKGLYEGAIAKMFIPPGENQNPVCSECRGEQKNQPSLGLTIIKNMQRSGLKYENGAILDPRDGSVYNARMELTPDGNTLTVRGYLGIELLGRSQTWQRLPDTAYAQVDPAVIAAHAPVSPPGAAVPRGPSSPARQRAPAPPARGQAR